MLSEWLLLSAAVYRVARLLAYEDGPGDVVVRVRERLPDGSFAAILLDCPYCASVWLAAVGALLLAGPTWGALLLWLASAGGAAILLDWLEPGGTA